MIRYIFLFLVCSLMFSCEEVIEADVDTAPPKLVIEANIDWVKGTSGNRQVIKLTTTTGYYDSDIPVVSNAEIFVTNSVGTVFTFAEETGTGEYTCNNFEPEISETYELTVISNGQTYSASETMFASPEIKYYSQTNEGGFLGEDIEIRYYYDDIAGQQNFYLSLFNADVLPFPEYEVSDDEFFEGNEMFEIFSDEDLKQGDIVDINLLGISERYYNYMNILLEASGSSGNPFQGVPVTARGNIINNTNKDNFALGYFRVCEVTRDQFTVR